MSPRLDLPLAVLAWCAGFLLLSITGSWLPLAVMAVACAARLVVGDRSTRQLLKPRLGSALLGLLGAAAMIAGTFALYRPLTLLLPALPAAIRHLYELLRSSGSGPIPRAMLTLVVSVSEEIIWRGRILASPADATPPGWPDRSQVRRVLGAAVIYGAAHVASGSITLIAVAAVCGFVWGLLRVSARSLWASLLTHALWDLAIMVLWPLT